MLGGPLANVSRRGASAAGPGTPPRLASTWPAACSRWWTMRSCAGERRVAIGQIVSDDRATGPGRVRATVDKGSPFRPNLERGGALHHRWLAAACGGGAGVGGNHQDRKSTRLNSSHANI